MGGRAHRGRQVRGMSLTGMMGCPESPPLCFRNSGSSGGVSCPVTWDNRFPYITGSTLLFPMLTHSSLCLCSSSEYRGRLPLGSLGHRGLG